MRPVWFAGSFDESLTGGAIVPADESAVFRDEFAARAASFPDFEHAVVLTTVAPARSATVITDFGKRNVMVSIGVALFCGLVATGCPRKVLHDFGQIPAIGEERTIQQLAARCFTTSSA